MKKRLGLLDYKDWALDAIVGRKDFLNLSVRLSDFQSYVSL